MVEEKLQLRAGEKCFSRILQAEGRHLCVRGSLKQLISDVPVSGGRLEGVPK